MFAHAVAVFELRKVWAVGFFCLASGAFFGDDSLKFFTKMSLSSL